MRKDEILVGRVSELCRYVGPETRSTYKQRMLKAISKRERVIRLAMPRAKHKIMQSMPHLPYPVSNKYRQTMSSPSWTACATASCWRRARLVLVEGTRESSKLGLRKCPFVVAQVLQLHRRGCSDAVRC